MMALQQMRARVGNPNSSRPEEKNGQLAGPVLPGADNTDMPTQNTCISQSQAKASDHSSSYQQHIRTEGFSILHCQK